MCGGEGRQGTGRQRLGCLLPDARLHAPAHRSRLTAPASTRADGPDEACTITANVAIAVTSTRFATEAGYDQLTIGSTEYSGDTVRSENARCWGRRRAHALRMLGAGTGDARMPGPVLACLCTCTYARRWYSSLVRVRVHVRMPVPVLSMLLHAGRPIVA